MIRRLARSCPCPWSGTVDVEPDGWWRCPDCDISVLPRHPPDDVADADPLGAATVAQIAKTCGVPPRLIHLAQSAGVCWS